MFDVLKLQQGESFCDGCYSKLKSLITAFVRKKKSKRLFLFTRELSIRTRTEGEDSLNILHKTHYLLLQAHLSDSILNKKHVVPLLHQKGVRDKPGISECFKSWQADQKKKKKGASKEHLPPPAHVVVQNTGSTLAQQNNIISCETTPLYAKMVPFVLFQVSSDEYKRVARRKSTMHVVWNTNTFSLIAEE